MSTKDKARERRLQKCYGISCEEYERLLALHNGNCWICGRPPGTTRLSVDHDHRIEKTKIRSSKNMEGDWSAWALAFNATRRTKQEALAAVRKMLRRASVRGLLHWPCNKGLAYFRDNPELLHNAAYYLEDYNNGETYTTNL